MRIEDEVDRIYIGCKFFLSFFFLFSLANSSKIEELLDALIVDHCSLVSRELVFPTLTPEATEMPANVLKFI